MTTSRRAARAVAARPGVPSPIFAIGPRGRGGSAAFTPAGIAIGC